jgi:hypothetical protein
VVELPLGGPIAVTATAEPGALPVGDRGYLEIWVHVSLRRVPGVRHGGGHDQVEVLLDSRSIGRLSAEHATAYMPGLLIAEERDLTLCSRAVIQRGAHESEIEVWAPAADQLADDWLGLLRAWHEPEPEVPLENEPAVTGEGELAAAVEEGHAVESQDVVSSPGAVAAVAAVVVEPTPSSECEAPADPALEPAQDPVLAAASEAEGAPTVELMTGEPPTAASTRPDETVTTGLSRGGSRAARSRRGRVPGTTGSAAAEPPGPAPPPTAGWYPDPLAAGGRRYWDGVTWTGHVMAPGASTPGAVSE